MNLQERLQQLAVERQNLIIALHEINGAMKILEQQILEIQETSAEVQPSNKEASAPQEVTAPSE
jgi:hypothetical protein